MALLPETLSSPTRPALPSRTWFSGTWLSQTSLVCGLLFLATVLNYLDRQVLSLTAENVMAEFHLDRYQFGEVVSSFRYSYAAVQLCGGWLVDVAGARLIFPLAVGVWSAAGICTGWSRTIADLRTCRFVLGAGEAFNWPCALKTTEQLLPPHDRAFGNGLFNGGTAIGAMLAPVVVTLLVKHSGWRTPFWLTGVLGFVWVLLWLGIMGSRSHSTGARPTLLRQVPSIMLSIARRKEFFLLAASAVVINGVSYFLADWIPLYLKTERGFGFRTGNALSMLVYVALDSGYLLTGYLVRRAMLHGASIGRARNGALGVSCILMSSAPVAGFTPSRFLALVCIALTALGVAGFLVVYLTTVQDVDPLHVGTTAGMLGGVGNLVYGMLAPFIGRLSDLHHTAVIFLLIGILPWLAYLCIAPVIEKQSHVKEKVYA